MSPIGTTDPKYRSINSGYSFIASEIEEKITPCLLNSSWNVVEKTGSAELFVEQKHPSSTFLSNYFWAGNVFVVHCCIKIREKDVTWISLLF